MAAVALLLGLMAGDPAMLIETASRRLFVVEAPVADAHARFRLPSDDVRKSDQKARALATDGQQCSIVGARLCTRKRRPILSAAID